MPNKTSWYAKGSAVRPPRSSAWGWGEILPKFWCRSHRPKLQPSYAYCLSNIIRNGIDFVVDTVKNLYKVYYTTIRAKCQQEFLSLVNFNYFQHNKEEIIGQNTQFWQQIMPCADEKILPSFRMTRLKRNGREQAPALYRKTAPTEKRWMPYIQHLWVPFSWSLGVLRTPFHIVNSVSIIW